MLLLLLLLWWWCFQVIIMILLLLLWWWWWCFQVTVLAALKEGALLDRISSAIHAAAVKVSNERRLHAGSSSLPALRSIHPLRLHRH